MKNSDEREDFNFENLKKDTWPAEYVPGKKKYAGLVCDYDTLQPVASLPSADFPLPIMEVNAKGWAAASSQRYGERIVVLIDSDGKIHHAYYRGNDICP